MFSSFSPSAEAHRLVIHHRLNLTIRPVEHTASSRRFADCSAGVVHPSRQVCCNATCGLCGGHGCSGRPGGPRECCMPAILRTGQVCESRAAVACILRGSSNYIRGGGVEHRGSSGAVLAAAGGDSTQPTSTQPAKDDTAQLRRAAAEAARDSRQPWGNYWPREVTRAYVTFADADDRASLSALRGLGASLMVVGSRIPLVILTSVGVTLRMQQLGGALNATIVRVPPIDHLPILSRAFQNRHLSKLNIFRLPVRQLVYLDSDIIVLQNIDHLFAASTVGSGGVSAARDTGSACSSVRCRFKYANSSDFNSGVMVIRPSPAMFERIISFSSKVSGGGDQALLNAVLGPMESLLDQRYNTQAREESRQGNGTRFDLGDVAVLHFAGEIKPYTDPSRTKQLMPQGYAIWERADRLFEERRRHFDHLETLPGLLRARQECTSKCTTEPTRDFACWDPDEVTHTQALAAGHAGQKEGEGATTRRQKRRRSAAEWNSSTPHVCCWSLCSCSC